MSWIIRRHSQLERRDSHERGAECDERVRAETRWLLRELAIETDGPADCGRGENAEHGLAPRRHGFGCDHAQ
jgi:hypothetical protein